MNNKKIAVTWLSLVMLLSLIVIIVEIAPTVEAPTIWYVDDSNPGPGDGSPGNPFKTIQAGVDNATPGDTVFVYNGTYYENLIIDKTLNLIAEDINFTILNGSGSGDVITVIADWVNITSFMITGSGPNENDAGIELNNIQNCRVFNNNISLNNDIGIYLESSSNNTIVGNSLLLNDFYGIRLSQSSNDNYIINNKILNNWGGIHLLLASSNNTIINNTISSNDNQGIHIWSNSNKNVIINNTITSNLADGIDLESSSYNFIAWNNISNNGAGVVYGGISYLFSNNNTITNNYIFSNNDYGVLGSMQSKNNKIINNTVLFNNNYGIYVGYSSNTTVTNNRVLSNNYGIYVKGSKDSKIYHNNIINNTNQGWDNQNTNYWDNGYPSGGNYWSDYNGVDLNSTPAQNVPPPDGIGDTPYKIDADSIDNYPFINPFGNHIFLYEGWNLISIPFIQLNTNLSNVLNSIDGSYDSVQWYNISDVSDHWKHNHTSKPPHLNDFDNIDHTMGFWIHIIESGGILFRYLGIQPIENQTISLYPGWNLVGYPSLNRKNRTEALNNIDFGTDVDAIWTYNATSQKWKEITATDNFEVGWGYWIHSKVAKTWIVPL